LRADYTTQAAIYVMLRVMTAEPKYGAVAIFFHWLTALALLSAVILALYVQELDLGDTKALMLALHKSIGLSIFILAWARLAWRLTHRAPPLPGDTPIWQRIAAHATHTLLYLTVIAMPVSGYISVAARGRETAFFGLFMVPEVVPLDRALSNLTETLHRNGQYALYALVALHVGAAAYHHFIKRDGLLRRMWPRSSNR